MDRGRIDILPRMTASDVPTEPEAVALKPPPRDPADGPPPSFFASEGEMVALISLLVGIFVAIVLIAA